MSTPHRMLPQSPEAERGVIGSILIAPDYALGVCEEIGLTREAFHIPANAEIYSCLSTMHADRAPIDLVTVTERLRDTNRLAEAGGVAYVTETAMVTPTAAMVAHYARIIDSKATLRGIIATGTEFAGRGYDEQDNVNGMLDEFEARVLAISGRRYEGDSGGIVEVSAKEGAMQAINDIEQLYERRGKITGIPTGFHELDVLTDGLHGGEMIVIGARPSMGKTALLMDIALHAAVVSGVRVAVFSVEMSAAQLYQRAICSLAKVNIRNVRDGFLPESAFPALTKTATAIASSKLIVLDAVGATIGAVRARARRLHRKDPLGMVVVDYLQKLRHPPSAKFREREIAEVSEGLKSIAKELNVPVVTAAQINRSPDGRAGDARGVPRLSDLRESGSIEQDADLVCLLHRPEVYVTDPEEKKQVEGIANLEIVKQRSGPLGDVRLTFLKQFTSFSNRAREAEPESRDYHQP